jgi:hypothetical protein
VGPAEAGRGCGRCSTLKTLCNYSTTQFKKLDTVAFATVQQALAPLGIDDAVDPAIAPARLQGDLARNDERGWLSARDIVRS